VASLHASVPMPVVDDHHGLLYHDHDINSSGLNLNRDSD